MWLKIDDGWYDHPKVIGLPMAARGMWITGLVYAGRKLTDGFIPGAVATREEDGEALANMLVDAHLWDRVESGYVIHDYLKYNPSKSDIEARRKAKSEAGSAGAKARVEALAKARVEATSKQHRSNIEATSKPVPVPVSPKERDKSLLLESFERWYGLYPRKVGRKAALKSWEKLTDKDRAAVEEITPKFLPYFDTRETEFIPHPSTFLNQRRWEDEIPQPRKPISPNGYRPNVPEYVNSEQY